MSLDREIEELLAVDHSPEFVAKVRLRVAAEPVPASGWLGARLIPIAAALVVVAAAAVLWPSVKPASREPNILAGKMPPAADAPPETGAPAASASAGITRARTPLPRKSPAKREVVVIAPEEAAAFDVLLARVSEGQLPEMQESLAALDATGPEWIEILPVVIEPINGAEGE
jgi:hypothetical protein